LKEIEKLDQERKKDKQIIAQALVIFRNIESVMAHERGDAFQSSVLRGIDEIKNALLRIYDFVEKIG
jgi:isopentenyl diphosphate isomerase/L-lactate dehydrogenase-like FMN-dependent dehydrogenase